MSGQGGTKVVVIRKRTRTVGHHGGSWKVAYADFVTAMMALFIVLWLLTQSDEASKQRISEYFRTGMLPGGTMTLGTPAGSSPPIAVNIFPDGGKGGPRMGVPDKEYAAKVEQLVKAVAQDADLKQMIGHLKVTSTPEGTLIELVDSDENFLFPVGSAGLKPQAVRLLEKLAPLFDRMRSKLEIHGHTDGRPFGDGAKANNWTLSFERADEARRVLEASGVPGGRITAVQAHADSQPRNKHDLFAAENRRLALLIVRNKTKRKKTQAQTSDTSQAQEDSAPEEPQ